ncbi:uncharacterized protein [Rhodnius prolixus]|uniref:uncharacterized protein n=1 Tax=Rhodnius prolixus TaxID=13249 RepID=UPI003D1891F6
MDDIKILIRQRGTVKGKVTRLLSFINEFDADDVGQLEARQSAMPDILNQFEEIQFKIENIISDEEVAEHEEYRTLVHNLEDIAEVTKFHYLRGSLTDIKQSSIPYHIQDDLADPTFSESANVDILLGAEIFFQLLKPEQIVCKDTSYSLIFQNTVLGWIASGTVASRSSAPVNSFFTTVSNSMEIDTNEFKVHKLTPEEKLCNSLYEQTFERGSDGRFIVELPFKKDPECLSDNLNNAVKRFHNLEQRFHSQPQIHKQYVDFMREYEQLEHMEEIKPNESVNNCKYYVPHHPVFKESTTTHIRVVFDATTSPPDGISLNSILLKGPVIQSDLFSIMLRFRMHKYVLTADIAKMYRQILIKRHHVEFQRIVWRESPNQELKHYRLLTLTYGTTPASFIATRCLVQLAEENKAEFPTASMVIERDFYMDDLMTGADDFESLKNIQLQVTSILSSGCFTLRKWCSNSKDILKKISSKVEDPYHIVDIGANESIKTLGLAWKPFSDTFEYKIQPFQHSFVISRRTILSELFKIFDPLGFLTPVVIKGKIFIQQLWMNNLKWDDQLPYQLAVKWCKFFNQLSAIEEFQIPRRAKYSDKMELHGFCDASENAYAASVYLRSFAETSITVQLLCAKARVAPLKKRTLPELELNGAQLLTRLMLKVANALNVNCRKCRFWTDSSIVLAWLKGNPYQWKTYVSNRVAFIQENTLIRNWKHVRSEDNPSDVASRGVDVRHFMNLSMWFNGPYWLALNEKDWPPSKINENIEEIPEAKPIKYSLMNACRPQSLLTAIRQMYWPIKGKIMAKQICRECVICFKAEPKNKPAIMGHLPKDRVSVSRPFSITGLDFAGPIIIKSGVRKSTKTTKAYICVFVCFAARAIHLEVVSDLTTNAFLAALRRFMSRRGVCTRIYSDNATNFVGAAKELNKLFKNKEINQSVPELLASEGIEWKFIPARSPHFGGIWEAGVKSVKYHLKRVIGNSILNFEELYTVLTQIEAILNSRPLTYLSSCPEDLSLLTPSHFLVGDSLAMPSETDTQVHQSTGSNVGKWFNLSSSISGEDGKRNF